MDLGIIGAIATSGLIFSIFHICCGSKLLGKIVEWERFKTILILFLMMIGTTIVSILFPPSLKIIPMFILYLVSSYFFFIKEIGISCILVLISQFIIMISETLFVLVCTFIFGQTMEVLASNCIGIILINIVITAIAFLSLKIPAIQKLYEFLTRMYKNMKTNLFVTSLFAAIIYAALAMIITYVELPRTVILICNTILIVIYATIVLLLARTHDKYKKISGKYETSLTSLKEYEDMMDRYRVTNHENKNQLLTIRNMIKSNDKTTIDYIDKVVDNKIKDNENIFYKTSKIPEGGLRATIYAKLCKMAELKINYNLDIANDVRAVDLITLGDDTVLNACKVIGVFLDNAIEEVTKLRKKEIVIELFVMDECLCIDISNRYKGNIELDKMENARYTTKGEGHGYGLTLVSEIIKSDKRLENIKAITKTRFTQKLKIKM